MTPELALQSDTTARRPMGEGHLTEEQFGELIAASARTAAETSPAEAHLRSCEQCAAEIAGLRECLSLFREASTAYADSELRRMPRIVLPARRLLLFPVLEPAYWVAAAAIFLAALLPMQTLHRHTVQPAQAVAAGAPSASVGTESDVILYYSQKYLLRPSGISAKDIKYLKNISKLNIHLYHLKNWMKIYTDFITLRLILLKSEIMSR